LFAASLAIVPQRQQLANVRKREPYIACDPCKTKSVNVEEIVLAVTIGATPTRGDQANGPVIPDHLCRYAGSTGGLTDIHVVLLIQFLFWPLMLSTRLSAHAQTTFFQGTAA
jgi:hypothetical protein